MKSKKIDNKIDDSKNKDGNIKVHKSKKIVDEELSYDEIFVLTESYKEYCQAIQNVFKNRSKKGRLPNFPEHISENIVRLYIEKEENCPCTWYTKSGDLQKKSQEKTRVEVKCFTSDGPSSFGPTEPWDELYFLDATDFLNNKYKIYRVQLSNKDDKVLKFSVNKKNAETFEDQCKKGRRPRFHFRDFKKKNKDDVELVFIGSLEDLNPRNNKSIVLDQEDHGDDKDYEEDDDDKEVREAISRLKI